MIASGLIGLLSGLLLGARFKVFATIPIQMLVLIFAAAFVLSGRMSLSQAALSFLCICVSLQLGYLIMLLANPQGSRTVQISSFET